MGWRRPPSHLEDSDNVLRSDRQWGGGENGLVNGGGGCTRGTYARERKNNNNEEKERDIGIHSTVITTTHASLLPSHQGGTKVLSKLKGGGA